MKLQQASESLNRLYYSKQTRNMSETLKTIPAEFKNSSTFFSNSESTFFLSRNFFFALSSHFYYNAVLPDLKIKAQQRQFHIAFNLISGWIKIFAISFCISFAFKSICRMNYERFIALYFMTWLNLSSKLSCIKRRNAKLD